MISFLFSLLVGTTAFATPGIPFVNSGGFAKSFLSQLNLDNQCYIIAGTLNPSSTPVLAPECSMYLSTNGFAYIKQDAGSSTNWNVLSSGGTVSSVAMTVPTFLSVAGSPITTTGTLAVTLSGTALPIANGGTNSTSALNNNRVMQSSGGAVVEAAAITANDALISNANGIPIASVTTATELSYVSGVTSAIQTQINNLAFANQTLSNLTSPTAVSQDLIMATGSVANVKTTDGSGSTNSLGINFQSGNTINTAASGNVVFASGSSNSATGSGTVTLNSGNGGTNSTTGAVTIRSGNTTGTAASGALTLATGTTAQHASGVISMATGNVSAVNQNSGQTNISTGTANSAGLGLSGNLVLTTGTTGNGNSGDISLTSGATSGTGNSGNIKLAVGTSSSGTLGVILNSAHISSTGTTPAVSACGTSPSIVGNDDIGRITVGTGGTATSCTITFSSAWANAPICMVTDETTSKLLTPAPTTTSLVISAILAFNASDNLSYQCFGYQ